MKMIEGTGLFDMCDEIFTGIYYYDAGRCVIQFKNSWILISDKQYEQIVKFIKRTTECDDDESTS